MSCGSKKDVNWLCLSLKRKKGLINAKDSVNIEISCLEKYSPKLREKLTNLLLCECSGLVEKCKLVR